MVGLVVKGMVSLLVSLLVNQSIRQSISQSTHRLINQSIRTLSHQPINRLIRTLRSQPIQCTHTLKRNHATPAARQQVATRNPLTHRLPFGFRRDLFILGDRVIDELAFEEYRAAFYTVQPAKPPQTPRRVSEDAMDCGSDSSPKIRGIAELASPKRSRR